jgi:hypothetical protein
MMQSDIQQTDSITAHAQETALFEQQQIDQELHFDVRHRRTHLQASSRAMATAVNGVMQFVNEAFCKLCNGREQLFTTYDGYLEVGARCRDNSIRS